MNPKMTKIIFFPPKNKCMAAQIHNNNKHIKNPPKNGHQ